MSRQATQNAITLKGSTEIVAEFFGYSINSILYMVSRATALPPARRTAEAASECM